MRNCILTALLALPVVSLADDERVCCRETALSFVEGWDSFDKPWNPKGAVYYTNGVLTVAPDRYDFHLLSDRRLPGAKPFRAPRTMMLVTEGAPDGGTVNVVLRNRDRDKSVCAKTNWFDRTVFHLDLTADEYWKVERIDFFAKKGTRPSPFRIRTLDAFSFRAPAEAIRLDVDTGSPLHVSTDPSNVVLTLFNSASEPVSFECVLKAVNYFGDAIEIPVSATLGSEKSLRVPVRLAQAKPEGSWRTRGIWRVSGRVRSRGSEAKTETRFAVLNMNKVTPRLPYGKFRLGIDAIAYKGRHRQLTLDALTACGAKLVRNYGFAASDCWRKPEKMDFSSVDKLMSELKERGLSVSANCWPIADWMVPDERRKQLGWPKWIRLRAKRGVMGEYAEKLAAHFGSDIDYVETSNEADLWGADAMSAEEYVDYQKEVFAGVRRGCPDIKVLPSAWAFADSTAQMVRRKGFLEKVMADSKGFYDIHPIHMHGGFSVYEKEILGKLMPLRERLGITVPWYASETSNTTINGAEDGVARLVWMKILFSWAHGASDYIWFNLRGTGWRPSDPEQGFGLLSADYYPRATYAAFSALANIVTGLDFDGIVSERDGRHLYRFRGTSGGRPVRVMAGWDRFTDPPFPIRIRTDATRAVVVDLMGNSRPAETVKDGFVFPISKVPSAIVLNGATKAEAYAEDADNVPAPKINARDCPARIEGREPDFVLNKVDQVRQLYAANPETVDRTWKGPSDLSAKVWIGRAEDCLRIRFEVTDDRHVQHYPAEKLYLSDGIQFILESPLQRGNFEFGLARSGKGEPLVQTWIAPLGFAAEKVTKDLILKTDRKAATTVYDVSIPLSAIGFCDNVLTSGFRFNCIVYDDDGRGKMRDNWIEIVPGIAGSKDYALAPFVRIAK